MTHYVLGGPQNSTNAFSLGTATKLICNEWALTTAMYSRKISKGKKIAEK